MFLTWNEVAEAMDLVEEADHAGVVAVFNRYRDQPLDERYHNGVRMTVNINTFCWQFGLQRQTFRRWLMKQQLDELNKPA